MRCYFIPLCEFDPSEKEEAESTIVEWVVVPVGE